MSDPQFQEVRLGDGTLLRFPAEMSDQDIANAIEAEYGDPRVGTGYRRASGERVLGIAPGINARVSPQGRVTAQLQGEGLVPSGIRAGASGVRSTLSAVSDLVAGTPAVPTPIRAAAAQFRNALPEVEATPTERVAGELMQYAGPGAVAFGATRRAVASAPRVVQTVAPALSAVLTDFAVTDPDTATTLGDAIGMGPTQIEPEDTPLQRRAKVAAESAIATAAMATIFSAVPSAYRTGRRIISAQADVDNTIRRQLRDVYSRGQFSGSSADPIDEVRGALGELINAREKYNSLVDDLGPARAILQIDEEMRPFVAGGVQVTPGEYLAARKINVGGLESYYAISGTEQARALAAQRRETTSQALGDVLGRGAGEPGRLRDIAGARNVETGNLVQRLYDDILQAHRTAEESYSAAVSRSDALLQDADELREAGRIDAAARAEREAASNVRDALYGAIDPSGSIPLSKQALDRAYSRLTREGQLTEELGRANIGFGKLQAVLNRVRRQPRMSYRDVLDIQRELSGIIRSANKNNSAFTDDLIAFRNTVRDEYLAQVESASPVAAEISRTAREFMAEDFAPRFRRLAGQVFDSELRRAEGTGSRRIVQSFINTGATSDEDAAILNRILMGTRVDDQAIARIARAAGVENMPLGTAALETRSLEAYQQSVENVADYYVAMLSRQLREAPSASPQQRAIAARRFVERYSNSIRQFQQGDGSNPIVSRLNEIVSRLDDTQQSAAALRDIERAATRVGNLAGSVRDINPQNAHSVISRLAGDMTARGIDDAAYAGVIRDLSRASDALAARGNDIVARRFADTDPGRAIGRIFGSADPADEMRRIVRDIGETEMPALRAAIAEHIIDARIGPGPISQSNLQSVSRWLNDPINQRALRQVYSGEEIEALRIMGVQIQNMNISPNMRTKAFSKKDRQLLFDSLMQIRREITGATQGMGQQVRVTNQARLFSRLRSLFSDNPDIQGLMDQRLVEIAHDPRAAAAFLEPISEERIIRETQALIESGRVGYLAVHSALRESERQDRAQEATDREYTGL